MSRAFRAAMALCIAMTAWTIPGLTQAKVSNEDRNSIVETVRARVVEDIGHPADFTIRRIEVDGNWAFLSAKPQRRDGPVDWSKTKFAQAFASGVMAESVMALLQRRPDGSWALVEFAFGAKDPPWEAWIDRYQIGRGLFEPSSAHRATAEKPPQAAAVSPPVVQTAPGPAATVDEEANNRFNGFRSFYRGDYALALRLLTPLAENGDANAQSALGEIFELGNRDIPRNDAEAAKWYRLAAQQGDVLSQQNIGAMYATGRGVPQDYKEATNWYLLAAQKGNIVAQRNLGAMYATGQGVERDMQAAIRWTRTAAEHGDAIAQSNLGSAYESGDGLTPDFQEAAKWYRAAADHGNALAQVNLGAMYQTGRGVPRDDQTAAKFYLMAADQDNARAQVNLGRQYWLGQGVAQNDAEAIKWFRRAAPHGDGRALLNLGAAYALGRGVAPDPVHAYMWFVLAAPRLSGEDAGSAATNAQIVAKKLNSKQIEQARDLAKQCEASRFLHCE